MKFVDLILTRLNGVKGKRLGFVVGLALLLDAFAGMGFTASAEVKWPIAAVCIGYMIAEGIVDLAKVLKGGIHPSGTGTAPKE